MSHYHPFILPFAIGFFALMAVLLYKTVAWCRCFDADDWKSVGRHALTFKTIRALSEMVRESLFHRNIFKINPLLGWMHMTFAFGWLLLIVVGKFQTTAHTGEWSNPVWYAIFFRYFETVESPSFVARAFAFLMDAILLFVLSGVALAVCKRVKSSVMGLSSTIRHTLFDRFAVAVIWAIFPMRLLAESVTSAVHGGGSFLTGSLGTWLAHLPFAESLFLPAWWGYSAVLGVFFAILPKTRYMHIPAEMVFILFKNWGVKSRHMVQLQTEACSRCGICIDQCAMTPAHIKAQAVYMLRSLRNGQPDALLAQTCLDCGSCAVRCPVGIDLGMIRRSVKSGVAPQLAVSGPAGVSSVKVPTAHILYFPGCIGNLTPSVVQSMQTVFGAVGASVAMTDEHGMECCGRPLFLSGNRETTASVIERNNRAIAQSGANTLVTSCPACYKMFTENYRLNIEVLHHSQWIGKMVEEGKLHLSASLQKVAYHDPCELGRGCNVYAEPRAVLGAIHHLLPVERSKEKSVCCGGSLSGYPVSDAQRQHIAKYAVSVLEHGGPQRIVTACPMCKKTLARYASVPVSDIAEEVARHLKDTRKKKLPKKLLAASC